MGHLSQVGCLAHVHLLTHIIKPYSKDILKRKNKAWDTALNTKLFDYLCTFFNDKDQVFKEIGIQRYVRNLL